MPPDKRPAAKAAQIGSTNMYLQEFKSDAQGKPVIVRLVREGIGRLGDPTIKIPAADDYEFSDDEPYFFSLDVDFGGRFVLTCQIESPTAFDPDHLYVEWKLASAILERIIAASRRDEGLTQLVSCTRKIGERTIRSSRTGIRDDREAALRC